MNWFATELHCHTQHSDGQFTVNELITAAKKHDLDGIALTDHNTISGWAELPDGNDSSDTVVLKGIEWTTFFGHMLVMDCPVFVDWRDARPANIDNKISEIITYGGLAGIAHPFELGSPMCTGCYWDYAVQKWDNISFIEVWSETFPSVKLLNKRALEFWNSLLDKGHHIAATYGKDWHADKDEAEPVACTYIGTQKTNLTASEIKKALSEGRTAITLGPKFLMEAEQGERVFQVGSTLGTGMTSFIFTVDENARLRQYERFSLKIDCIRIIGNGGIIVDEIAYSRSQVRIECDAIPGWYRGELWGSAMGKECCLALTSPVYFR